MLRAMRHDDASCATPRRCYAPRATVLLCDAMPPMRHACRQLAIRCLRRAVMRASMLRACARYAAIRAAPFRQRFIT